MGRALAAGLGCAALAGVVATVSAGAARPAPAANAIVAENRLAGHPGWDHNPPAPSADIDGYASSVSVAPGQVETFHITGAPGVHYRLEIFRLGWYGGDGARLIACVPACRGDTKAVALRPAAKAPDPKTGFLDAGWPVTDSVRIPADAVSGLYLAKALIFTGPGSDSARDITFVVREAQPRAPILVQIGVNTQEAYNDWGGKSLYTAGSTHGVAAVEVSFNRPEATPAWEFNWDYQLIRFLEHTGYDLGYATDVDTDRGVDAVASRRLVIVPGHSEYWTKAMRDALQNALAHGTNMAFMGANTGYWQARYADDDRTLIEYRSVTKDPDPDQATKTTRFRQLKPPRPECQLEGVEDNVGTHAGIAPPPSNRSYSVAAGALSNPWFHGSGITQASVFKNLVGYEWDTANLPGCPRTQVLFTWSGTNTHGVSSEANAATFTAPSGAKVFAAGSFQFSWGLDGYTRPGLANHGLQVFARNMLDDLSK